MDNYKIVEVKIIMCVGSDVYSSYMASSNPEYNDCLVIHSLHINILFRKVVVHLGYGT
jgi:hypothetical protein